jgi:hypothetical protein
MVTIFAGLAEFERELILARSVMRRAPTPTSERSAGRCDARGATVPLNHPDLASAQPH